MKLKSLSKLHLYALLKKKTFWQQIILFLTQAVVPIYSNNFFQDDNTKRNNHVIVPQLRIQHPHPLLLLKKLSVIRSVFKKHK